MNLKEKKQKLEKIAYAVGKCRKCPLWKNPKAVPGEGSPEAEIMLVGEAPGYHESVQGRPFVGAAGKLLTQLLKSIGFKRSEVFICNMLRHRPPGNRDPLPSEIEACRPFLDEQIKIINPKIIVTLGRFSMAKFLPNEKISQIHGQARFVNWKGKKLIVLPMYHPAAALRRGEVMRQIKEDFQKIPQLLRAESTIEIPEESAEKSAKGGKTEKQLSLIS